MNTKTQYRYEQGKLYKYDSESNAYILVLNDYRCRSKLDAIRRYESED